MTAAMRVLQQAIAGKGHPEYPFLDPVYSPGSRVPCVGFAEWLADRIAEGDLSSCRDLVWELVRGNPGLGRESWDHSVALIVRRDIRGDLSGASAPEACLLKACVLLMALDGGLMDDGRFFEGILLADDPRFIAQAGVGMSVGFPKMPEYVEFANRCIKRNRREFPGWRVDLYSVDDLRHPPAVDWPGIGSVRARLSKVSVSARQHFFDILASSHGGKRQWWRGTQRAT